MKFMSTTAVFIAIAAFAICATGSDASLQRRLRGCSCGPFGCSCTFKREDLAVLDAATGDDASLQRRLRGCSCGPYGCSCTLKREDLPLLEAATGANEDDDSLQRRLRGCSCGPFGCSCTLKREDLPILEAATGSSEDDGSLQRRLRGCACGPNGCFCTFKREDLAVMDAATGVNEEDASLQRRLRGCSCGPYGCSCTLKREDLAVLEAATSVIDDAAPTSDNGESADDEQSGVSLRRRLRGCSCGPFGCSCTFKREDLAVLEASTDVNEDGASLQRRQRGCYCGPQGCECTDIPSRPTPAPMTVGLQQGPLMCRTASCGPSGCKTTVASCRMKREDAALGADANEDTMPVRARRSDNCQWQCVCTSSGGAFAVPRRGRDVNAGYSLSVSSGSRPFTVTNGRCGLFSSFGQATCQSVQTCN